MYTTNKTLFQKLQKECYLPEYTKRLQQIHSDYKYFTAKNKALGGIQIVKLMPGIYEFVCQKLHTVLQYR